MKKLQILKRYDYIESINKLDFTYNIRPLTCHEIHIILRQFCELAENVKKPNNFCVAAKNATFFPPYTMNFGAFIKSAHSWVLPYLANYKEIIGSSTVNK